MTPNQKENLQRLLAPRHIAFVGGNEALYASRQCAAGGFNGQIWGVNPKRHQLDEHPCFASVDDLPEAPDAAFVAVPAPVVPTVVDQLRKRLHTLVPKKHRDFLASFEEIIVAGDYAFVHAGVNPKQALDDQKRKDLLWIRERFLAHGEPFEKVIVHGHTIFEDVEQRPNRIGIDTGAFRYGRLTALVLDGETRRYIQAVDRDGDIAIEQWDD